jgi:low temperature requirement protein LtrA
MRRVRLFMSGAGRRLLLDQLSPRGAVETLILLMAVWSAWSFTTWTTSWFDAHTVTIRFLLVGVMLGVLWLAGGVLEGDARVGLWALAMAVE